MSSGKVHNQASAALAGGFLLYGIITRDPACIEYAAGALAGTLLSPDLDVDAKNLSYKFFRKYKTETLWSALWHFYRRSIKHGSELSHFPVISTLGRLAYMFFFLVIIPNYILSLFGWNFEQETLWWANFAIAHWKFTVGLMGIDFIHWFLDIATSDGHFNLDSLLHLSPVPHKKKTL